MSSREDEDDRMDEDEGPLESDLREPGEEDGTELTPCPSCGEPIYEDAERCPRCGQYVLPQPAAGGRGRWLWAAAILAGLALLLYLATTQR